MANEGTQYNSNLANSQVNDLTDTVYGQLQRHTDFSNPLMQRVGQQAKDKAASRGLGNTTIAQRAATGAVVDQAGKFATKDAEIYSNRRTENQRADTVLANTSLTNESALVQTRERNTNALEGQRLQNAGNLATTNAATASQERVAAANNAAANWQTQYTADSNLAAGAATNARQVQTANIDADVRREMNELQQQTLQDLDPNDPVSKAWDTYQTAVANIDPNAKPESQLASYNRIKASFEARMTFLSGSDYSVPATPNQFGTWDGTSWIPNGGL
jgi:hypothetical protein